jgi:hypothetical protein
MGMWNRVRTLWENDKALDSTAEELLFSLGKMSQQYPSRDLNAWLAWGLSSRPGWGTMEKQELLLLAAPCSITTQEQATALLALDVVIHEYPELERVVSEKRRELYLPVDVAIKNGSFLKRWKDTNPWTDENFPAIEQELKLGLLNGVSSKAVEKLQIKCPKCPTTLRIPSFTGGKKIRCPKCNSQFSVDP